MNRRVLYAVAFLLLGLMIGWIVSRFDLPETNGLVPLLIVFVVGLGVGAVVVRMLGRGSTSRENQVAQPTVAAATNGDLSTDPNGLAPATAVAATAMGAQT